LLFVCVVSFTVVKATNNEVYISTYFNTVQYSWTPNRDMKLVLVDDMGHTVYDFIGYWCDTGSTINSYWLTCLGYTYVALDPDRQYRIEYNLANYFTIYVMGNNPINSMEFGVMDANLGVMNESYREQIFTLPFTMTEYNAPPYTLTYTGVAGCSDWFDMGDYTDDCEETAVYLQFCYN